MSWTSDVRAELAALDLSARRLRAFGLTLASLLLAAGAWLGLRRGQVAAGAALLAGGLALGGLGLFAPGGLRAVYRRWMALALAIGWAVSRAVLVALFLLAVTPTALLARLLGKRFLELGADASLASYWERREPGRRPDYRKLY